MRIFAIAVCVAACGCGGVNTDASREVDDQDITVAEAFIDAFYSFDSSRLDSQLASAQSTRPEILFYQGWAEGGHYRIVKRARCARVGAKSIACPITVEDDLMKALGIDFNVTDTFTLDFSDGRIVTVETSSNDLQQFYDAEAWVRKQRPQLVDKPCQGYFAGGPTPGACVKAMVEGFKEFSALEKAH